MLVKSPCLNCGTNIEFDAENAGQFAECPSCNTQTRLGGPVKNQYFQKPAKTAAESRLSRCADCGHSISVDALFCPSCGNTPGVRFKFVWQVMCYAAVAGLIFSLIGAVIFGLIDLIGYLVK